MKAKRGADDEKHYIEGVILSSITAMVTNYFSNVFIGLHLGYRVGRIGYNDPQLYCRIINKIFCYSPH